MRKLLATVGLLAASPVAAQDWTYSGSLYLWFPQTNITADTPLGTVEGELSISDALQDLDFAFMGALEARNGPWGFIGDFIYMDLSTSADTPRGLAFSQATVDVKMTMLSAYGMYRLQENEQTSFDVGIGARSYWSDIRTSFSGNLAATRVFETDDQWVDPLLAARFKANFSDDWYGALFLDGGGFGVGSDSTFQAIATVGYRINDRWAVQGGYRYLSVDKENDEGTETDIDVDFSGPILGAVYNF
jgi:opacity protein-like surface antigen